MADSLLDLCQTTDLFTYPHNWVSTVEQDVDFMRTIIQYTGTPGKIKNLSDDIPVNVGLSFTNLTKTSEYDLLKFFCDHRGRCNRFWLPIPEQYYVMAADALIGSNEINIAIHGEYTFFRGYERMFMILTNGDMLTRRILDFDCLGSNNNIMTIESVLDRNIAVTDVLLFGKLILCRFDQDEVQFTHENNIISSCALSFQELTKEYITGAVS